MLRTFLATALVSLSLSHAPVSAAPAYRLTDLGGVDSTENSFSYGISGNGQFVAGWVEDGSSTRAFRWSQTSGRELLALDAGMGGSRAFGVNNSGVVAGEAVLSPTRREATLWSAAGARSSLGTLQNPNSADFSSVAFGINNAGTAAGWSDSTENTRAFRWTSGGGMRSVGVLPGGTQTRAYSINAAGDIAGWGRSPEGDRGFVAETDLTSVGALSADPTSRTRAYGISNSGGWITGDAKDPSSGETAFLWSPSSALVSLGVLEGAQRSFGAGVNSNASVVGWNEGGANGEQAFLWTPGDGMLDLNAVVVDGQGWLIQRARAINDMGYIVANAVHADGSVRAVLLTPVPEPSTWALMFGGLSVIGLIGFRRQRA